MSNVSDVLGEFLVYSAGKTQALRIIGLLDTIAMIYPTAIDELCNNALAFIDEAESIVTLNRIYSEIVKLQDIALRDHGIHIIEDALILDNIYIHDALLSTLLSIDVTEYKDDIMVIIDDTDMDTATKLCTIVGLISSMDTMILEQNLKYVPSAIENKIRNTISGEDYNTLITPKITDQKLNDIGDILAVTTLHDAISQHGSNGGVYGSDLNVYVNHYIDLLSEENPPNELAERILLLVVYSMTNRSDYLEVGIEIIENLYDDIDISIPIVESFRKMVDKQGWL